MSKEIDVGAETLFGTLTLGQLITVLDQYKDDGGTTVKFDFCHFAPAGLHSYRGSYDHLAISYSPFQLSLETFLAELKGAVGQVFTGWKGGQFVMDENTPIWVDMPGDASSTAIVGVRYLSGVVYIETKHVDI